MMGLSEAACGRDKPTLARGPTRLIGMYTTFSSGPELVPAGPRIHGIGIRPFLWSLVMRNSRRSIVVNSKTSRGSFVLRAWLLMLTTAMFVLFLPTVPAHGQPTGHEPHVAAKPMASPETSSPFTGTLTVRQKGGSLYYQIYVVRGAVIGGYDTWRDHSTHFHRIVGGWYDGKRMVLLIQSTQGDLEDQWFSHTHHFEKEGDQFIIKQSLYGFGKTIDSGEVYVPHIIDVISELPAERVKRLAASADHESLKFPEGDTESAALKQRNRRIRRENARLKALVSDLVLEKRALQRKLRDVREEK